ncbi:amino acid permease [Acidomonas methanolica]|uniref:Amino acid permease n=2 Tax=Acidomonas methanolica TaxID=437 RepID=A0A023D5V5_ACIMT|nr:amino acid permease [Acidomonas methanolica]TCS25619.1 GABA permease [Acidomonas methanolica]GAJ29543.1 amino acid permease [Acidomonas methanolica NBRC 104435]GEK98743.1 GABA permease [Acidomonas methanolica NBRC 104435]
MGVSSPAMQQNYTIPASTAMSPPTVDPAADSPLIAGGKLKDRHIAMIALGGAIGAGLFVGSSAAIHDAGPAVFATYVVTGLMVVIVMRMLGEMLLFRPGIGTFVDCIRTAHGPGAGFLAGWLYWLFWVVTIGAEAIGGAIILNGWSGLPVWMLAPLLIVAVNIVNAVSVDLFGECEFWLSFIKVSCIIAFAALGAAALLHLVGPKISPLANIMAGNGPMPNGLAAVVATIPTVLFSMIGSEAATVAAAESENARENLGKVTRRIGLRLTLFCLVSVGVILCLVPWTSIVPGHSPFVTVMQALGIPGASMALQIVVFSAVLSCLNSSIYITSRTLYGLAEKGDAPDAFRHLSRHAVPQRAVLASSLIGLFVAFCSILSPGVIFAFFISATGAVILVVYGLIVSAHWAMRGEQPDDPVFTLPLGRGLNMLMLGGMAMVMLAMLIQPDQRGTVLSSIGSVAVLSLIYAMKRRTGQSSGRRTGA